MRKTRLILNEQLTLRNRLVVPPMASGTGHHNGSPSTATLDHYRNLSEANAGLVFVEYTYVHRSGRSEPNQLGIDSDLAIPQFARIAEEIKKSGAIAGIQLTHAGGKSKTEYTDGELIGPSDGTIPSLRGNSDQSMRGIDLDEITALQQQFLSAIDRASKAGFQVIELHLAHGYGLNQWLSPLTNKRRDQYGGNVENRTRIITEILTKAKELAPSITFSARFPGSDLIPGGISQNESLEIAEIMENNGVELFNVSSGIGGWRRPPERRGEGYLVEEATRIKQAVKSPVIGVGGIKSIDYIESILLSKKVDLVAVGRAILDNPREFSDEFSRDFTQMSADQTLTQG